MSTIRITIEVDGRAAKLDAEVPDELEVNIGRMATAMLAAILAEADDGESEDDVEMDLPPVFGVGEEKPS